MAAVLMIFGWPAVITSVVLTVAGISTKRWSLVVAGAVVGSPFLLYLFLTPRFQLVALPVAALHFAAAAAIARNHQLAAVVLFAPFVGLVAFLMWLVVNQ
jgi:hypothetical protein